MGTKNALVVEDGVLIKQKTLEIREKFNYENILNLPIIKLAKEIGFNIYEVDFKSINERLSGVLRKKSNDDKPEIILNRDDCMTRKRFTIAHELGHYFLHCDGKLKDSFFEMRSNFNGKNKDPKEIEANKFAAELLVPEKLILLEYKKMLVPEKRLLAIKFGVSEDVIKYRLKGLGIDD